MVINIDNSFVYELNKMTCIYLYSCYLLHIETSYNFTISFFPFYMFFQDY